jgi:hypothetical protein
MELLYSLTLAFQDLKRKEVQKLSIINGIIFSVLWLGISFLAWGYVKDLTVTIINLLPFKFIQNAGAYFILIILWIQTVLISIGIVFSVFNSLISKKLLPLIISFLIAFFWLFIFFANEGTIISYLEKLLRIFPFETIEDAVATILAVFILYSFYIATLYHGFLALSAKTIEKITKEEYPDITINRLNIFKLMYIIVRDLILFFVAFLIFYPLLFIPFINLLIIIFLWAFLIKESLSETIKMLTGKEVKKLWLFSFLSVIFNFIPLVNFYAPAFGEFLIYRYVMEEDNG